MIISGERGKIEISDAVMAELIGRIVRESAGVAEMAPRNLTENLVDWLGIDGRGRGVALRLEDNGLVIRLSVQLWRGVIVSECVGLMIQNIQRHLEDRLGIYVAETCVDLVGLVERSA